MSDTFVNTLKGELAWSCPPLVLSTAFRNSPVYEVVVTLVLEFVQLNNEMRQFTNKLVKEYNLFVSLHSFTVV